ncbi:MAG: hypothetical protein H5T74_00580 [Actinobacteria bacterium]|nr:hypothetical protein [Actinomycetota bacterium]MDI6830631.1 hypothetical protein [Actinomycetota bacterium]
MQETATGKHGAAERLLRELIRSPKFKASLRVLTANIDPATASGLARTLLWEDAETFMGTVSLLPGIINFQVALARGIAEQLNSFPPDILAAFLMQLVEKVDFAAVEEAVKEFKTVLGKLAPVVERLKESSAGLLAQVGE